MKKTLMTLRVLLLMVPVVFSGCVSYRAVSDFSAASSAGIRKFEEIKYSFRQHCYERVQFDAVRNFDIQKEPAYDCDGFRRADSVTFVLYNAISGYFTGLKNLANNDLTNYKLGPLKKSISEGNFGSIRIDKTDADSYAKISTILLNASTGAYRKNRLKHYIDSGNEPIQVLLAKFRFIIRENLKELLDFKKEKLYTYYMEMKMSNSLSVYEKGRATIEYYEQLSVINAMQKQISTYAGSLQSIAKGHQDIYDNKNKMTAKELKELLIGYTADIQDIISEFNKLKN